ncbi:hypothetical protein BHM03_00061870 [Ensete ventricosum]|nr:hypothetical protein BHM03_00061870 [Ensete ventricosum]
MELPFSQKDALIPLAPSTPPSSSFLPLHKRWQPLPPDSHLAKGRPPLRSVAPCRRLQPAPFAGAALQASVLAGGCHPFGLAVADRARRRCPCQLLPRQVASPLRVAAPPSGAGLPYGLALAVANRGLAVGGRPYIGAGRGRQPLLLTAFAVKIQQERVE